ncbi:MAG: selenium cofactor biosynthesis protein YqeC [Anaerolineae bacterium]
MLLSTALRIQPKDVVVLVGGGGKTTAMFRLAEELQAAERRVVTTMTTKIFVSQMARAPGRLILEGVGALLAQLPAALADHGHVLIAGGTVVEEDKVQGVPPELLDRVAAHPAVDAVLVEADGSRRLPFKAPAAHEPVIPSSATIVAPMVGLDVVGQPLDAAHVHRPGLVAALTGAALGDPVTPELVAAVLAHPDGGAKGLPPRARFMPILNKVNDAWLPAARQIARLLLANPRVDSVLIAAVAEPDPVHEVWGRVGAVVLAAGEARRFGGLKQVLPWRGVPLVAHVAAQALACPDIARVAVTVGAEAARVREALTKSPAVTIPHTHSGVEALAGFSHGTPNRLKPRFQSAQDSSRDDDAPSTTSEPALQIVPVPDWAAGQSRSVRAGLEALVPLPLRSSAPPLEGSGDLSAIIFLLADQPGITPELLSALIQRHRETLAPVVAPRYRGQRGNPVLFDRATFPEFERLTGDVGARPIIQAHASEIAWVDWPTPEILQDIDTAKDYKGQL